MAEIKDKLRAWTLVDELVQEVHAMTRKLPSEQHQDMPALLRQSVLRAALGIVQGMNGSGEEFDSALRSTIGSLSEFRYYLYLSKRLGVIEIRRYRGVCLRHDRIQTFLRELLLPIRRPEEPQEADRPRPEIRDLGPGFFPFPEARDI